MEGKDEEEDEEKEKRQGRRNATLHKERGSDINK